MDTTQQSSLFATHELGHADLEHPITLPPVSLGTEENAGEHRGTLAVAAGSKVIFVRTLRRQGSPLTGDHRVLRIEGCQDFGQEIVALAGSPTGEYVIVAGKEGQLHFLSCRGVRLLSQSLPVSADSDFPFLILTAPSARAEDSFDVWLSLRGTSLMLLPCIPESLLQEAEFSKVPEAQLKEKLRHVTTPLLASPPKPHTIVAGYCLHGAETPTAFFLTTSGSVVAVSSRRRQEEEGGAKPRWALQMSQFRKGEPSRVGRTVGEHGAQRNSVLVATLLGETVIVASIDKEENALRVWAGSDARGLEPLVIRDRDLGLEGCLPLRMVEGLGGESQEGMELTMLWGEGGEAPAGIVILITLSIFIEEASVKYVVGACQTLDRAPSPQASMIVRPLGLERTIIAEVRAEDDGSSVSARNTNRGIYQEMSEMNEEEEAKVLIEGSETVGKSWICSFMELEEMSPVQRLEGFVAEGRMEEAQVWARGVGASSQDVLRARAVVATRELIKYCDNWSELELSQQRRMAEKIQSFENQQVEEIVKLLEDLSDDPSFVTAVVSALPTYSGVNAMWVLQAGLRSLKSSTGWWRSLQDGSRMSGGGCPSEGENYASAEPRSMLWGVDYVFVIALAFCLRQRFPVLSLTMILLP